MIVAIQVPDDAQRFTIVPKLNLKLVRGPESNRHALQRGILSWRAKVFV